MMNITKLSISNFFLILKYEFLSNLLVSMSCKFRLGPVRVLSDKSWRRSGTESPGGWQWWLDAASSSGAWLKSQARCSWCCPGKQNQSWILSIAYALWSFERNNCDKHELEILLHIHLRQSVFLSIISPCRCRRRASRRTRPTLRCLQRPRREDPMVKLSLLHWCILISRFD